MTTEHRDEAEVARAIGELPRALPPKRDLWPGIERKLSARSGSTSVHGGGMGWRSPAIAAAVAVAFAAGVLLGRQVDTEAPGQQHDQTSANRALLAATHATEQEYRAAFKQFISVGATPAMLGQQAVQNIEGSWFELQQAETALLTALEEHPENSYLNQKLLDLRAQQLEFMKQLAMLDQFSRRKT